MEAYTAINHTTIEGEFLDLVQLAGEIAAVTAAAGDGKTIGLKEVINNLTHRLDVETDDYENKRAAITMYDMQPQHGLFGRAYA